MDDATVLAELRKDEGLKLRAYKDTRGIWTIGYGTNLQTLRIDEATAEKWLVEKYKEAVTDCIRTFPWYTALDVVRRGVLASMVYQMGLAGVQGFQAFLTAVGAQEWDKAAEEMLDSKWARSDSPARAKRMATRMRTGQW